MSKFFNEIGIIAVLVLFPFALVAQTCGTIGDEKYSTTVKPFEEFDTVGEACAYVPGHDGIPDSYLTRTEEVEGTGSFRCYVEQTDGDRSAVFTGSVMCYDETGDYTTGPCKPASDCECRPNSGCCPSSGGGGGGGDGGGPPSSNKGAANDYFAGDPVSIAQGYNYLVELDWVSPKDSRLRLSRIYKSGGYGLYGFSRIGYALGWSGNWSYSVFEASGDSDARVVYTPGGKQHRFSLDANGIGTSDRPDEASEFELIAGTGGAQDIYLFKDGKGVTFEFLNDGSSGLSRLSSITWPDGYKITFRFEFISGQLSSLEDNRDQRAELTWVSNIDPDGDFPVISEILVDSDYDGAAFSADVKIEYSNSYESNWGTGLILNGSNTTEIVGAATLKQSSYTYAPFMQLSPDVPMLLGYSDHRLNGVGQSFDYSTFTYDLNDFSSLIASYRAVQTEHANGTSRYDIDPISGTGTAGDYKVTNPLGKETDYSYDWIGGTSRPTQIDGLESSSELCEATTRSLGYTPNTGAPEGYVYERVHRNGAKTTYERDARGLILTKTEDANGLSPRITTYTWDTSYRLPLTRTTSEMEEAFGYDTGGLLTSYSQKDVLTGSPTLNQTRTWTYAYTALASGLKVLTSVDGPLPGTGDVTTYVYNTDGTLASMTDPNGLVTSYSNYDVYGNATRVVLPDGVAWSLTYDARGLLTESIENVDASPPNNENSMTYVYDIVGLMTSHTDGLGQTYTYTYDEARRLTEVENPAGYKMEMTYDLMGNVTKTTYVHSNGSTTFFEDSTFDELGRLRTALGAINQQTTFGYDKEDNLTTLTDTQDKVETNKYDALNRIYEVVDRASRSTDMDHNDADQVTQYTDARNNTTVFTYNGFGEVVQEVSPDRGTIIYAYDERGLVTSMTDARGIVSNYAYDNGGRITGRTFPSSSSEDQTFTYDFTGGGSQGGGKIHDITNDGGTISRTYANGGYISKDQRIIPDTTSTPTHNETYDVQYSFDDYGRLLWLQTPAKLRLTYTYNNRDEVLKIASQRRVIDPQTGQFPPIETVVEQINYRPFGPASSITYGDGATLTQSYDQSYRLTGQVDQLGATTLRDVFYGWSNRNNLASAIDNLNTANSETFQYTSREFLGTADGPYDKITYTYNPVGDRYTRKVEDGATITTDTYSYPGSSNRLQSIGLGAGGTRPLTYDGAGNVVTDTSGGQIKSYTYNAAGRMESLTIGTDVTEYVYNALGQQVIRRLASGQTLHVIHDYDGNRLAEYDYDPATQTSTLMREYIWLDGAAVGVVENDTLYFVRTDHIGRPVFATDGAGVKVWEASYLPFGGVQTSTGSPIELRFPGQWFQAESGLHQNWMREYDPTTGQYLQADPLGLVGGPSVYGYALQNPSRYIDPDGRNPFAPVHIGW